VNKEQTLSWLGLVGAKPSPEQNRTGWVISSCPLGRWAHDHGKSNPAAFAAKLEPGDAFCNCFSCGFHGAQTDLVVELHRLNKLDPGPNKLDLGAAVQLISQAEEGIELELDGPDIEQVLFDKAQPHIYPENWLRSFPPPITKWATEYLIKRSVLPIIAEALDLRIDTNQRRICFPVRDFKDRLRGLHGRAVDADNPLRYRMYPYHGQTNPEIWLGEHYVELDKPIVVVEGPLDLTSVARVYQNVVSPLFANPSVAKLQRMADAPEWITLLDHGKGGDTGRARISKAMPKHLVTHLLPPEGSKDPGQMSADELIELLEPHVELDGPLLDEK
jgi:5S rRNA maturation endonuclease (ribonuclease M5)